VAYALGFVGAAGAAPGITSSLVRTIDTAKFSPPSPDPSGLAYVGSDGTLVLTDSEVEETVNGITHFRGVNLWQLTLGGSVLVTANISAHAPTSVAMTNEPTDIAWRPSDGHYFVSDDGQRKVFNLDPGGDGAIGTADDSWTSFSTTLNGPDGDPEGITYDTARDRIFVADGVDADVYEYTPEGSLVGHFDVARYGVNDPEGIEYNRDAGTLLVLSNRKSGPIVIETTTAGELLHTVDVSAAGARKPAALAYAPASNGSGAMRFFIADRGVDNNRDPTAVDGKLYEMTAPLSVARSSRRECPGFAGDTRNQIVGTPGNDILIGTSRSDLICGLGGNDVIRGRRGYDVILGGGGADILRGGRGNDTLRAQRGRDHLFGGRGNDRLEGGSGVDDCRGGPGADELVSCEKR
jgi:Ca2+-binding RTX toxin-like protein